VASGAKVIDLALSLSRKVLILVSVPVVLELFLVGSSLAIISNIGKARAREAHARTLASHWNSTMSLYVRRIFLVVAAHSTVRGPLDVEADKLAAKLEQKFVTMAKLVEADPREKADWQGILDRVECVDKLFTRAAYLHSQGDKEQAALVWLKAQSHIQQMFDIAEQLVAEQSRLQRESADEQTQDDLLLQTLLSLSVIGSVFVAFGLAYFFNQGTTRRFKALMVNAGQLAAGQAPSVVVSGSDELAKLNSLLQRTHRDLTSLRMKERAILDNAAEVIASVDGDLRFSNVNKAVEMWNFSPEDLLGRRLIDLVKPGLRTEVADQLSRIGAAKSETRFETTVLNASGAERETAWAVTSSPDGRSLYCVISDISERKRLEQVKQEFVAMLSHDLRTPLTSVLMSLELLSHPSFHLAEEGQGYLAQAERSLQVCVSLINELLEIERYEAGMLHIELAPVNLRSLAQAAIDSLRSIAQSKDIPISLTADLDSAERLVKMDGEKISRVFINLLANAIKFSAVGAKIVVKVEYESTIVRAKVIDRGRGIPADQLDKVFDRFQQLQSSDGQSGAGSGLGLAICRAIIEAHHGKIGVYSEVGKGSTFWFELPR
jgi:PAS domain S-box-containing protein